MNEKLVVVVRGTDREAMLRKAHALATQYADEYVVLKVRTHSATWNPNYAFEMTMTVLVQA